MELRLLGRFDVVVDGAAVSLGGPRQRAFLAVLAIHANEIVSVDRLAEEVWGPDLPATAVVTMQRYISHLRRALDGLPVAIETRRPGYVLLVDPDRIDAQRFERLVDQGRAHLAAGAAAEAGDVLSQALALWRGDPLADFSYESFARIAITRLEELRAAAVELRIDADLELGRHRDLVPELEALVAAHPLRESYRGQLMRALHRSGRQGDALRVYQEGRHVLAEEMGLDPGIALQELEKSILADAPVSPAAAAPAPPAVGIARGRLPAELTSFVGRSSEVEDITGLLTTARLVTLTGAGGSGKSRLALRVASAQAPALASGAWLVELGAVTDPAIVPQAVAMSLGVREDSERPVAEWILDALAEAEGLLVVDGCEHLLDAVAALVQQILSHTTDVRILVTSREILDVPGEAAFRVPTLSVPSGDAMPKTLEELRAFDSVRLFLERAAAADSAFAATDEEAATIADLCRRLDGLPLALELAAARTDVLTLRQLADRLDDRFEVLTSGWRTAPPRHRTLRATIGWSYDLLTDDERLLFDRLSVFAGSFTVEHAEAVCGGDELEPAQALNLLSSLVRKSLVVRVHTATPGTTAGEARYRLLDTLRDFGRERLHERPDGAATVMQQRHAEHFTRIAEAARPALRSVDGARLLDALESEHLEFRAVLARALAAGDGEGACRLAAALSEFWDTRYHVHDGRMWLERAIAAARQAGTPPTKALLWATVHAEDFAYKLDDFAAAIAHADDALAMLELAPDPVAEARVLTVRGEVARFNNDLEGGEEMCVRAAALCTDEDDDEQRWFAGDAYRVLSLIRTDRGNIEGATAAAEECLRLYARCGNVERTAGAHALVAGFARDRGDLDRAIQGFAKSLATFQQIGEPLGAGLSLWAMANTAVMQNDADAAEGYARASLQMFESVNFPRGLGEANQALAEVALLRGDLDEAERWCEASVTRFRERGYTGDLVIGLTTRARVHMARDELDPAVACCEEALDLARGRGSLREIGRLLRLRAELHLRVGAVAAAATTAREGVLACRQGGDARGAATGLVTLAKTAVALGHRDEAESHLAEARAALAASAQPCGFSHPEAAEYDEVARAAALVGQVWVRPPSYL